MPHQKHFPVTVTKRERNMKMPFTYTQLRKLKYKSVKSPGLLFCAMNLILMLKKKKKQYDEINTEFSLVWLESVDSTH